MGESVGAPTSAGAVRSPVKPYAWERRGTVAHTSVPSVTAVARCPRLQPGFCAVMNHWPESDSPGAWRSADGGALARPANGCGAEAVSQDARIALTPRTMLVYAWATGRQERPRRIRRSNSEPRWSGAGRWAVAGRPDGSEMDLSSGGRRSGTSALPAGRGRPSRQAASWSLTPTQNRTIGWLIRTEGQ